MPTRARQSRVGCAGSSPSTLTSPALRGRYPSRISTVVVLPAPFGPSSAKHSPRATSRSSDSTATWCPYVLRNPRTWIAGSADARSSAVGSASSFVMGTSVPYPRTRPTPTVGGYAIGAGRCRDRTHQGRSSYRSVSWQHGVPTGRAGPAVGHAYLRRALLGLGQQRAVPAQPGEGADRAVGRLRPADPDRVRPGPRAGARRGGPGRGTGRTPRGRPRPLRRARPRER